MVFRRWLPVVGFCLLLFVLLAGYKVLQIRKLIAFAASFPEASETVGAVSMQPTVWQENLSAVGVIVAPRRVELRNQIEGRIVAVGFAAGAAVKKDQMLVQLDASEEISQLRAVQAEAELAQLALARYQKLMKQNVSSRDQYDQARAQHSVAIARAQELQARIDKKTLTAPFDAQAGLHQLQVGEYLAANTLITQLLGVQDEVWVDFDLPQQQANVALGSAVDVNARGILSTALHGKIIAAEPALSAASRNLRLRAAVDNAEHRLQVGALVDVSVAVASRSVFAVPVTALHHDTQGSYVYVIQPVAGKEELRASVRRVQTGAEKNQQVVIESGLQQGEQVATTGSYKLQENMLTHIRNADAALAAPAAP